MKKVVLSLAVLFSMAMVSCGGNNTNANNDSDTVVAEEVTVTEDSNACGDSINAEAEVVEAPAADSAAA